MMEWSLILVLPLVTATVPAAPDRPVMITPKPQQPLSPDDQLLRRLPSDAADEFDRKLFEPEQGRPVRQPDSPRPKAADETAEDLSRRLLRELGPAGILGDDNPLLSVARQMRDVQQRIGRADLGPQTQDYQQRIVSELDRLIEQVRRQCQPSRPAENQSPAPLPRQPASQPASQPKPGGGEPGTKPGVGGARGTDLPPEQRPLDMDKMREVLRNLWGELPEKAREQMLQLPVEEFLPQYQSLIEEYFKRLALEKQRKQ